jgi:hypothetical protein
MRSLFIIINSKIVHNLNTNNSMNKSLPCSKMNLSNLKKLKKSCSQLLNQRLPKTRILLLKPKMISNSTHRPNHIEYQAWNKPSFVKFKKKIKKVLLLMATNMIYQIQVLAFLY